MSIEIYVLEEHPIIREVLCEIINLIPDMTVCGTTGSAEDALMWLAETTVDILLADVDLRTISGVDFLKKLRSQQPTLPCLALSTRETITMVRQVLAAGAGGVMLKYAPREIEKAIRQVLAGRLYLSPQLASAVPVPEYLASNPLHHGAQPVAQLS